MLLHPDIVAFIKRLEQQGIKTEVTFLADGRIQFQAK
jgi:hypothetical protein